VDGIILGVISQDTIINKTAIFNLKIAIQNKNVKIFHLYSLGQKVKLLENLITSFNKVQVLVALFLS